VDDKRRRNRGSRNDGMRKHKSLKAMKAINVTKREMLTESFFKRWVL